MAKQTKAAPWPFFAPEKAVSGPLGREMRKFYEDEGFPETGADFDNLLVIPADDQDYIRIHARPLLKAASRYNGSGLLGLLLVATGANIEGSLFEGRSVTTIGSLVGELDLKRGQMQYSRVDFESLLNHAANFLFESHQGGAAAAERWFENEDLRGERLVALSANIRGSFYDWGAPSQSKFIVYSALAFYTRKPLPKSSKHGLPKRMMIALLDLSLPLSERREGLIAYCDQKIPWYHDKLMPMSWIFTSYLKELLNVIAPLAILKGQDVVEVAGSVKQILDLLFEHVAQNEEGFSTGDPEAYEAGIRVALMSILWNHPEHWDRFSLVAGDMLGVEMKHLLNKAIRRETAVGYLLDHALIPRDGADGTFGAFALKLLGDKHNLFDPRHIQRRYGSCNPIWVKKVKDFSPAADDINFMMGHGVWHPALEGDRVSKYFGEPAALNAIVEYVSTGGNAKFKRAQDSLARFPSIINQVLGRVSKRSEVARLVNLTSLTSEQIDLLPEHLHETILVAELGL